MAISVADDIADRIAAARVPGSPNNFTVPELRELVVGYLGSHDEELGEQCFLKHQPHWNLWMSDGRLEDALFVVMVFRTDSMEFACGVGSAFDIRHFADSDFPDDPEQVVAALSRRFRVPMGAVRFPRAAAEHWLGRGW
jgi:hypothetical protein